MTLLYLHTQFSIDVVPPIQVCAARVMTRALGMFQYHPGVFTDTLPCSVLAIVTSVVSVYGTFVVYGNVDM